VVLRRSRDRDDFGAERVGNLHARDTHAARGTRDERTLTRVELALGDERVVGSRERLREPARLFKLDVVGKK
jgi:hypothetical protein